MFNLKTTIQVACGAYSIFLIIITGIMPKRLFDIKSTAKKDVPNVSNVSLPHGFLHLKLQKQRTVKTYLNVLDKLSILYRKNMDRLIGVFLDFFSLLINYVMNFIPS